MVNIVERSNSLGFRDREHDPSKPDGNHRIVVLGDSITQGFGLDDVDQIFTSIAEQSLRRVGADVDVLNFGVNGYNTEQEVELLREKGLILKPDLVIVAYCMNDSYLDSGLIHQQLKSVEKGQSDRTKVPSFFHKSALFRLIWSQYLFRTSPAPVVPQMPKGVEVEGLVSHAFNDLRDMASEHNFEVLVMMFPMIWPENYPAVPSPYGELKAMNARNDFHSLELTDCDFKPIVPGDHLHPDADGHQCAGEALAREISRFLPNFSGRG